LHWHLRILASLRQWCTCGSLGRGSKYTAYKCSCEWVKLPAWSSFGWHHRHTLHATIWWLICLVYLQIIVRSCMTASFLHNVKLSIYIFSLCVKPNGLRPAGRVTSFGPWPFPATFSRSAIFHLQLIK
jgi:hypothetical protein